MAKWKATGDKLMAASATRAGDANLGYVREKLPGANENHD